MSRHLLPAILLLPALPAAAATVNVGALTTNYADFSPPWAASINSTSHITVDLSDLSGLTPGADIQITFTTADALFWSGGWQAQTGTLTLHHESNLALSAVPYSTSINPTWAPFGPVPFDGAFSPVYGWESGPVPDSFTLTVPWGTNLSNVTLSLTDQFSITGTNPGILESSLSLNSLTLTTSSAVPEPGTWILNGIFRRRPDAASAVTVATIE